MKPEPTRDEVLALMRSTSSSAADAVDHFWPEATGAERLRLLTRVRQWAWRDRQSNRGLLDGLVERLRKWVHLEDRPYRDLSDDELQRQYSAAIRDLGIDEEDEDEAWQKLGMETAALLDDLDRVEAAEAELKAARAAEAAERVAELAAAQRKAEVARAEWAAKEAERVEEIRRSLLGSPFDPLMDEQVRKLHSEGLTTLAMMQKLGWTRAEVRRRLGSLGLDEHKLSRRARKRLLDQVSLSEQQAYGRDWAQRRRREALVALGDPQNCELCGKEFKVRADGGDGKCIDHRHDNDVVRGVICPTCNRNVAVADLRYTDPDLWRATLAWSTRGEPVTPTGRKDSSRRKSQQPEPTLFDWKPR